MQKSAGKDDSNVIRMRKKFNESIHRVRAARVLLLLTVSRKSDCKVFLAKEALHTMLIRMTAEVAKSARTWLLCTRTKVD